MLARYPSLTSWGGLLRGTDLACTGVFAISGAATAAGCGLDCFGAIALGTITALGGGTALGSRIWGMQKMGSKYTKLAESERDVWFSVEKVRYLHTPFFL